MLKTALITEVTHRFNFCSEGFNDRSGSSLEETVDEMTFEEEDDVDRGNVKDMSHVSVIKVGDDSSHEIHCARHGRDQNGQILYTSGDWNLPS